MYRIILCAASALVLVMPAAAARRAVGIGVAYQSPGSISFSVVNGAPADLEVTSFCYDNVPVKVYEAVLPVGVWGANGDGDLVAFAGAFHPPTGLLCGAYVHKPGSTKRLAQVSYVAP